MSTFHEKGQIQNDKRSAGKSHMTAEVLGSIMVE